MKRGSTFAARLASKHNITIYEPSEINITFDNLIGLENAKNDLTDVVNYIKDPISFEKIGIRPHIHYLIQGPDGVGKSSLAYAVAHAANIPIIVVDCKEFLDTRRKAFNLLKNIFKATTSYNYSVILLKL